MINNIDINMHSLYCVVLETYKVFFKFNTTCSSQETKSNQWPSIFLLFSIVLLTSHWLCRASDGIQSLLTNTYLTEISGNLHNVCLTDSRGGSGWIRWFSQLFPSASLCNSCISGPWNSNMKLQIPHTGYTDPSLRWSSGCTLHPTSTHKAFWYVIPVGKGYSY